MTGCKVAIRGVSVVAPGLLDWATARAVLCGTQAYQAGPLPEFPRALLPANERRRSSRTVKLALQAASAALDGTQTAANTVATVFASSSGDGEISDTLCRALAASERQVSPTDFHNSVHNAPAGYWSLASANRQASSSLSAHGGSFAAGLLEAAALAQAEQRLVLLVAYEHPSPEPLATTWPILAPFAVALLLAPDPGNASVEILGRCQIELMGFAAATPLAIAALEPLRLGNPAARSLPLLQNLARRASGSLVLPYLADRAIHMALGF